MRQELDEELCRIAPHLFADRYKDKQETGMCWGFECGDGWFELLKDTALKLEPLCKAEYDKYAPLEKGWYRHVRAVIGWSIKCSGLFWFLDRLTDRLIPNLNNPFHWYGGGPRASQVKEKYGTLRLYMTHGTEEMYIIIDGAERKSAKICESCGKPGRLRGSGWLYTRCASCWKRTDR